MKINLKDLKTVNRILHILFGLLIIVGLLAISTNEEIFVVVLCVIAILIPAFSIMFRRCPHCEAWLGRDDGNYCPHCGTKLEK